MNRYIKCDESNCGYIEFVDNITQDMVGKRCPVCSSNLLTQSDFEQWKEVEKIVSLSEKITKFIEWFGFKPKMKKVSLGREDLQDGETYLEAFKRKLKE